MDPDVDDHVPCGCLCTCSSCLCDEAEPAEVCPPSEVKQNHMESTRMVVEGIARVEIENEAAALREALGRHQQSILDLCAELEAERNASATATSEAMAMILRLQREKAECQMEARQFRRFAEEKMAHDQQEIATLEELLFKRDQAMQSLSCEVQAYKHRLLSHGILDLNPNASEPNTPRDQLDAPPVTPAAFNYPPLRCRLTVPPCGDDELVEENKYGDTPREHLQKLEQRICQLEKMPSNVMEKGVVVGQSSSPRFPRSHLMRRRFSSSFDSFGSRSGNFLRGEEFPVPVDRPSAFDGDGESSDRIYTIRVCGGEDSYASTPRDLGVGPTPTKIKLDGTLAFNVPAGGGVEQEDIQKLQRRLQALEADRESMRQSLISMGTDKAQMVLLREIAQQFCKDSVPDKRVVKHTPSFPRARTFSLMSVIKWITSVVFWRKRSTRIKYPFGLSSSNAGLLLLLEKSPRLRQRGFLTKQRSSC